MIDRLFPDHPRPADETYLQDALFVPQFALALFGATFAAMVHMVLPFLFEKTARQAVARLHARTQIRGK